MQQFKKVKRVLLVVGLSVGALFTLLFLIIGGTMVVEDIQKSDERKVQNEKVQQEREENREVSEQISLDYFEWFETHRLILHERLIAYDNLVKHNDNQIEARDDLIAEAQQDVCQSYYTINGFENVELSSVNNKHIAYVNAVGQICTTLLTNPIINSPDYLKGMREGLERLEEAERRLEYERERIEDKD